ncbi:hypothetical protein [Chondromyces apiculatus]|uniref:Uncharacterized protein n=1 Tax=Chondromyces apiculatus DSM 436 TaxID=1192034 RepID=A0A017SZG5_9BACT|nr:hypothetical protein [Chondromyces apiculatus]EYF01985.1 Hypothetical protein CAP_7603 [Chondromyces apiculatus DSM 436]
MASSDRSLARRTLKQVALFAVGSALFVALTSTLLVVIARALLPPEPLVEGARPARAVDEASTEDQAPAAATSRARPGRRRGVPTTSPKSAASVAVEKADAEEAQWARCCDALEETAKKSSPEDRLVYHAAIGACRGTLGKPNARDSIRTLIQGKSLPPECRW